VRIIRGEAKGRKIQVPREKKLRLTSDRVKESLFNLLPDMEGIFFLELFAGTGNVSLEALSRGAKRAVLVEKEPAWVNLIGKNLEALGFGERSEVITGPVERVLPFLQERGDRFDIVFADPPYEKGHIAGTLEALGGGEVLKDTGLVVVEHAIREETGKRYESLALRDRRRYGDTVLSFFALDRG